MPTSKRPAIFYGWVLVGVMVLTLTGAYGIWYSFTVFLLAIEQEFGWTRADTAAAFSVNMLVSGIVTPLIGRLVDRLGPRLVMAGGALLLAAGLAATSQITELWQLYLSYGVVVSVGFSAVGLVPCATVLQHWFVRQRGTALGLGSSGIGLGQIIVVPLAQYLISNIGWREAYLMLASLMVATLFPLNLVFQRRRPQDMGLWPDNAPSEEVKQFNQGVRGALASPEAEGWSVRQALSDGRFWFLFLGFGAGILVNQLVLIHWVGALANVGYPRLLAASIFSVVGLFGLVGKVTWGTVSDHIGRENAYSLAVVGYLMGLVLGLAITDTSPSWMAYAFAMFFGLGYGCSAPLYPTITADIFQGRTFGTIYGLNHIGTAIGAAVGPWLGGYIFDTTKSYHIAFLVCMASILVSTACVWAARLGRARQ